MTPRSFFVLAAGLALPVFAALSLTSCRGVLGIDALPMATASDAGVDDAATPDAEPVAVAATDAAPFFCDTVMPKPQLCADFDHGALRDPWKNDPALMGGTLDIDDDALSPSPPHSARFGLPALLTEDDHAGAFLVTQLNTVPRYLTLQFDLRIDTESFSPGPSQVVLADMELGPNSLLRILRDADGMWLEVHQDLMLLSRVQFAEKLAVGRWGTLSVLLHNDGAGAQDGEIIAMLPGLAATAPLPAALATVDGPFRLSVGVVASWGPMDIFQVNIDNVVIGLPTSR